MMTRILLLIKLAKSSSKFPNFGNYKNISVELHQISKSNPKFVNGKTCKSNHVEFSQCKLNPIKFYRVNPISQ